MLSFLQTFGSFVLVLGILVFVHEFGHFIVAKALRIGVKVFSIGFGPRLAGFRRGETDYRLAAVPLGGYVRLAGDETDEHRTGGPEEFLGRSRWQRFLVYVAGATFNLILAFVLTWLVLWIYGQQAPGSQPVVLGVHPGSSAEKAGILPGDTILSIEDRDAIDPQVEFEEILMSPNQTREVRLRRGDREITVEVFTGADDRFHMGVPGWELLTNSTGEPSVIGSVLEGSPAERAGLRPGDKIMGAEDQEKIGEVALRALLSLSPGKQLLLHVDRAGERIDVPVTPAQEDGKGKLGVTLYTVAPKEMLGFRAAAVAAWESNVERSATLFFVLRKLAAGKLSMRTFSGPLEIAQFSRFAVRSGMETFLTFLAFISLQLGILNLLPIPILDGGHITILAVESVMGRDLSNRVKERAMQAGMFLLLTFFGIVLTYDIIKTQVFEAIKALF